MGVTPCDRDHLALQDALIGYVQSRVRGCIRRGVSKKRGCISGGVSESASESISGCVRERGQGQLAYAYLVLLIVG